MPVSSGDPPLLFRSDILWHLPHPDAPALFLQPGSSGCISAIPCNRKETVLVQGTGILPCFLFPQTPDNDVLHLETQLQNPLQYQNYIRGKGGANRTEATADDVENALKNYANTNQRRRDMVRRLACCNFNAQYDKFFTLTFADNLTDVKQANYLFKKFKQKLQYKFGKDIKYLGVVEFQERGAVHYHVLSNIPYIPQRDLQDLWGHGFVFINAINHVDNIGAYIVKYMTKVTTDTRLQGLKAYLCSRNLIRPEE